MRASWLEVYFSVGLFDGFGVCLAGNVEYFEEVVGLENAGAEGFELGVAFAFAARRG